MMGGAEFPPPPPPVQSTLQKPGINRVKVVLVFINWQPSLKGLIQEIHEYDWFNLLAYGSGTERYQCRIHSNHNGSKVTCDHVETCRKYLVTSVIALFTLFYLV